MDLEEISHDIKEGIIESKYHYTLIITSAFSMMILLLTFTVESRNSLLDLGLTCLFMSIIFMYQLYNSIGSVKVIFNKYMIDKNETKFFEKYGKKVNKHMIYNVFGLDSFFLGLLFIFLFFNVPVLTLISIIYVNYLIIDGILKLKSIIKPMKKIELTVLTTELKYLNSDMVKSVKKSMYFSIVLMLFVEIINLIATFYAILFLINS